MIRTSLTLSLIAATIAFLIGQLGAFPIAGSTGYPDTRNNNNATAIEEMGNMLVLSYTGIIDDLASFQKDPSLVRAEERKQAFISLAQLMRGDLEHFSQTIGGDLQATEGKGLY